MLLCPLGEDVRHVRTKSNSNKTNYVASVTIVREYIIISELHTTELALGAAWKSEYCNNSLEIFGTGTKFFVETRQYVA